MELLKAWRDHLRALCPSKKDLAVPNIRSNLILLAAWEKSRGDNVRDDGFPSARAHVSTEGRARSARYTRRRNWAT